MSTGGMCRFFSLALSLSLALFDEEGEGECSHDRRYVFSVSKPENFFDGVHTFYFFLAPSETYIYIFVSFFLVGRILINFNIRNIKILFLEKNCYARVSGNLVGNQTALLR